MKFGGSILGTKKKTSFGGAITNKDDDSGDDEKPNKEAQKEGNASLTSKASNDTKDKGKSTVSKALRDFIQRALMAEVAYYPESIIHFVQANDARVQQSVGSSAWTYTTHS